MARYAGEHRIFGIRHHGPGSARALRRALEAWEPDCVLVEGPPEADALVPLVADPQMTPPVALLVYARDAPSRAVFYPFTAFSPEWQALRWAVAAEVPARFIDLGMTHQLEAPAEPPDEDAQAELTLEADEAPPAAESAPPRLHPFAQIAHALGEEDPERWWEELVEQRLEVTGDAPGELFPAVTRLMTELRAAQEEDAAPTGPDAVREARREAHMRRAIRAALKEGHARVAVVCGAWHAPALTDLAGATKDNQRLRKLPRVKVAATWIPWTSRRLAARSGYGAGVASPGWYGHLWRDPDRAGAHYVVAAARLLREEGLDTSSAAVIDTVRLADTLAALRDRPSPGLREVNDALRASLCHGEDAPMLAVRDALEIGREVGQVPDATPTVPLAADLARQRRSLRLKTSPEPQLLELDLRQPNGHARSVLFRRLLLLDIPWARPEHVEGARGSFRERWTLAWEPELEVELVTASTWGNTVRAAATARLAARAEAARRLAELAGLLDAALLADLGGAVAPLLARVEEEAARAADVAHLMGAVPPLARIVRYGDVRNTPAERVAKVAHALFLRSLVGLPPTLVGIDDEAAEAAVERIVSFHGAVPLLVAAEERTLNDVARDDGDAAAWLEVLLRVARDDRAHGLVRGAVTRLLLEQDALGDDLGRLARRALSPAVAPGEASSWLEGLLRGSGLVVLHQEALWGALDAWLTSLGPDVFEAQLPLVRRAFSGFNAAERRRMGERVSSLGAATPMTAPPPPGVDRDNARKVLPILRLLLGTAAPDSPESEADPG